MKRSVIFLAFLLLATLPALSVKDINQSGERVDVKAHLVPEKINIIEFVTSWDRAAARLHLQLTEYEKSNPDVVVLRVQVKNMQSPVAKQYNLDKIPHYIIYDEKGELMCQGQAAFQEIVDRLDGKK